MTVNLLYLTLKVGLAWAAGALLGLALFGLLREERGLAITRADTTLFVSFGRIALWVCLTAGVVVANSFFIRAATRSLWLK